MSDGGGVIILCGIVLGGVFGYASTQCTGQLSTIFLILAGVSIVVGIIAGAAGGSGI
jgi:hypothetical protein